MSTVYTYFDAQGNQHNSESAAFNFVGTWSNSGTYNALTLDTVDYSTGQFACIINNYGSNPINSTAWSPLVRRIPASGTNPTPVIPETVFIIIGTNTADQALSLANSAFSIAVTGTNLGTSAYNLAQTAYNTAISGTTVTALPPLILNNGTVSISQVGTSSDGYLSQADYGRFNTQISVKTTTFTNLDSNGHAQIVAHGLSHTPLIMSTMLVCGTNDFYTGMLVGQQIELSAFFDPDNMIEAISIGCDETNFYLSFPNWLGGTNFINWNGAAIAPAISNFNVKVSFI